LSATPAPLLGAAFLAGAAASLAASAVLVRRLERVGARLRLSGAALGIVAALAADGPEITAAASAVAAHQASVGAGVVLGSNVFNLAALLGLGALAAGRIFLHRHVVVLAGAVAVWVATASVLAVAGALPAAAALVLAAAGLGAYLVVLNVPARGLRRLGLPASWALWLRSAVAEEEQEMAEPAPPRPAGGADVVAAAAALVVVVVASVVMERSGSALGRRWSVPEIVVGAVVLAAVTSLPNSVSAVYLARRGRATATLNTALNSNNLNVLAGLLLPATIVGLAPSSGQATFAAAWYAGLTVLALLCSWAGRGVRRPTGVALVVGYGAFLGVVLAGASSPSPPAAGVAVATLATLAVTAVALARGRG
jgi:cation:H+ antiporter